MTDGLSVDPAVLKKASSDIIECLKQAEGMDLEGIIGSSEWYGHAGVYGAFARFCPTWQVAVTLLTERSVQASMALAGMAKEYARTDDSGAQRMAQAQHGLPAA